MTDEQAARFFGPLSKERKPEDVSPSDTGPSIDEPIKDTSGVVQDFLDIAARHREEKAAPFREFGQGIKREISAGYAGEPGPAPGAELGGKVGYYTGRMVGSIPLAAAITVGTGGLGAPSTLARTFAEAALYGGIQKPEEDRSRLKNAIEYGAFGGVVHGAIKGLGAAGRWLGGGREVPEVVGTATGEAVAKTESPIAREMLLPEYQPQVHDTGNPVEDFKRYGKGIKNWRELRPESSRLQIESPGRGQMELPLGSPKGQMELPFAREPLAEMPSAFGSTDHDPYVRRTEDQLRLPLKSRDFFDYEATTESVKNGLQMNVVSPKDFANISEVASFEQVLGPIVKVATDNYTIQAQGLREAFKNINRGVRAPVQEISSLMLGGQESFAREGLSKASASSQLELQQALQKTMEGLIEKTKVNPYRAMKAIGTTEPVENLIHEGMPYGDAAELVDLSVERGKLPLTQDQVEKITSPEVAPLVAEPTISLEPKKPSGFKQMPPFEQVKKKVFPEGSLDGLFSNYNTIGDAMTGVQKGLLTEVGKGFSFTKAGYSWLRQFAPDFLVPKNVEKLGISTRLVSAVRGQGFADIDLEVKDLETLGFKMGLDRGIEKGFLRKGLRDETGQLTEKGAAFVAAAKGNQGSKEIQALDYALGRRVPPGEAEKIALLTKQKKEDFEVIKDVLAEMRAWGKFDPDCL